MTDSKLHDHERRIRHLEGLVLPGARAARKKAFTEAAARLCADTDSLEKNGHLDPMLADDLRALAKEIEAME